MNRVIPSWWRIGVLLLAMLVVGLILLPRESRHASDGKEFLEDHPKPGANLNVQPEKKTGASLGQPESAILIDPQQPVVESPAVQTGHGNSGRGPQRNPLLEQRELLRHLQKQSAEALALRLRTSWLDDQASKAGGMDKRTERVVITTALTQSLQSGNSEATSQAYAQLSAWLRDSALPMTAKSDIARVLGSVQTAQSVSILVNEYQNRPDDALRQMLRLEIGKTGDVRWGARFHEELSPPLETAWANMGGDFKLSQVLAEGMAKVGRPEGVSLLVGEVLRSSASVDGLSLLANPQAQAALAALEKVRNPNAIPVLANGLLGRDSSEVQQYICGGTLSSMGSARATAVLLQWAATASDQDIRWADRWFGRMRDTASYKLTGDVLQRSGELPFQSARVREVVLFHQQKR